MDIRSDIHIEYTHSNGHISCWDIEPDIIGDFRNIPFESNRFSLVVFDPPHILRDTGGIITRKYGHLDSDWKKSISDGFKECYRVLRPGGFLNFKWSEVEIPINEVRPCFPANPMYSTRTGIRGAWFMFRKEVE